MKAMSKTILFFGNERLATGTTTNLPVIKALLDSGYKVPAIILSQHAQAKSRHNRTPEIADFAEENNILLLDGGDQIAERIKEFDVSAAVLVAYGQLVSKELIDLFPKGIINIHPSLLPWYRGSTPIESAILDGATETGVTLMSLTLDLDEGPIYDQIKVSLSAAETKQDLTNKLAELGADLLIKQLPDILSGDLKPHNQPDSAPSYTKRIEKNTGALDFNKPALELEREIRAYHGWPRSTTNIGDERVIITRTHVLAGGGTPGQFIENEGRLGVYTARDTLIIDNLIPAGKKEMSGQAFLAGHKLN